MSIEPTKASVLLQHHVLFDYVYSYWLLDPGNRC
jgi:hypothetical protein